MIFIICQVQAIYQLVRHSIEQSPARCLDGSPAALYYQLGSLANRNKFLVAFDGGGFCANGNLSNSYLQCLKRSKTDWGSSDQKFYPQQKSFEDINILSPNAADNPHFYDWTKVFVIYCDGTQYQGWLDDPVKVNDTYIYFRAYYNNVAHFKFLNQSLGLYSGDKIVLTGGSAGAIASLFWSNYVYQRVLNKNALYVAADSGLFLVNYVNPFSGKPQLFNKIQELFEKVMMPSKSTIPQCNGKSTEMMINCFNVANIIPHLKAKIMIIQTPYDQWSIRNILGLGCTGDMPGTLVGCNQSQIKAIQDYRDKTIQQIYKFRQIKQNKTIAVWSPACIQHSFIHRPDFNLYKVPGVNGISLSQSINQFINQKPLFSVDPERWPSNPTCSGLKVK